MGLRETGHLMRRANLRPFSRAAWPVSTQKYEGIIMENDDVVTMSPERKKPFFLFRLWQWLIAGIYGLLVAFVASEWTKLSLPGAPEN